MKDKIRWGIIGTGNMAHQFARGLRVLPDAELVAVGSRSEPRAMKFAKEFEVAHAHGTYEALAADEDIDVVYISTPHTKHLPDTLICLEHGKHVLCEKPFAVNAGQAEQMRRRAEERGLFLMEAMWTAFFPAIRHVRALIAQEAIGHLQMVKADFCFKSDADPHGRLYDPALAGGALLDVGIYPVALSLMVFGREPREIVSAVRMASTGVDERSSLILSFEDGGQGVLTNSITLQAPFDALVVGTRGWIRIPRFFHPDKFEIVVDGHSEEHAHDGVGNGYNYEAEEVHRCLREERRESADWPLDRSLAVLRTLDAIRAQWGLRYPCET